MKKSIILLILLSSLVTAQEPPPSGISQIDILVNNIQSMNASMSNMQAKIDNVPGLIQENYYKEGGRIIFGDVLGILIIYLCIVFFEKRRKLMGKKTHEQYIRELEDKLKSREDKIFDRFNDTTKRIQELTTRIESVTTKPEIKEVNVGITRGQLAYKQGVLVFFLSLAGIIALRIDSENLKAVATVFFFIALSLSARIIYLWRNNKGGN
jgi:tetrahydromethanopterin S-methyltransferase subunit G